MKKNFYAVRQGKVPGIYGLWIALAADEIIRGIFMIRRWRSGKWKTKRVVKE